MMTLLELRTAAKDAANMKGSKFLEDAEWNRVINFGISDLRDKMISKVGEDYFAEDEIYTLINGQDKYALPSTFYKLLAMEIQNSYQRWVPMLRFNNSEINIGSFPAGTYIPEIRYRLRDTDLQVTPTQSIGGRLVKLVYVPLLPKLTLDADTFNGFNGWEEYVIYYAARYALQKEESDTTTVDQMFASLNARIEAMADNRDQNEPARIQDTQSRRMNYGSPSRWG